MSVAKDAVDSGARDKMALRQLTETLSALPILKDGRAIENKGLASDVAAFELCPPHAGPDPFDDQVALQFGDRSDDDDNSSAQRTSGIDLLAEADELDVEPVQLIEHLEEVLHRPGDTIGSPDQDDIELTPAAVPHQRIESGPLGFGPADPVRILFNDLIPTLLGHLTEVIELGLRVLVEGGDSQVECGALHRGGSECNTHI